MRVGIYVPHGDIPDRRGFSPAIVAWNHALRLSRFAPTLFCASENGLPAADTCEGIPVQRVRVGRLYHRLFCKWSRLDPLPLHRRLLRRLQKGEPALWHVHQLEFPVADFRRRLPSPVPVLVHAHVTTHRFSPERGEADRYLAVSDFVRRTLVEAKGYPAERIAVLQNGVDTTLFRPGTPEERAHTRQALGIAPDTPVVLFAGRKQEVKGFDTFLRVAERLLPQGDAVFLAVGPEPADAAREASFPWRARLRKRLRNSGRYLELDALPQDRLAALFRAADVLLAPSRIETQGMVMIEGMAAGLVVISSATGGVLESIRHGETGLLLEAGADAETAAELLGGVLHDLPRWRPLAIAARAEAQARFSWEAVVQRLEDLYLEVIAACT